MFENSDRLMTLSYMLMFENSDGFTIVILGGILAFLLLSWIYGLIMQGVDAVKTDVEEENGVVKGCVQIIGWIFIGLVIYWAINM